MEKQKRITLNADKRKVIADVFFKIILKVIQNIRKHGKTQKKLQQFAKNKQKLKSINFVRFHQPQEDVDTIRSMVNKYGESGGRLYDDNCFHVQTDTPRMDEDYNGNPKEVYDDVHVEFKADKEFLTAYYRDEMKAKGIDADYDVRLGDNYEKRNPTYYNSESAVNKYLGYGSRNDVSGQSNFQKINGKMILNLLLLEQVIVIVVCFKLIIMNTYGLSL